MHILVQKLHYTHSMKKKGKSYFEYCQVTKLMIATTRFEEMRGVEGGGGWWWGVTFLLSSKMNICKNLMGYILVDRKLKSSLKIVKHILVLQDIFFAALKFISSL